MGKFCQVSTELWPLIYVRNLFCLFIFGIFLPIFIKLCMIVDIEKRCFGIADWLVLSNHYRVMALDWCSKLLFAQYLLNKWTNFDQILCYHIHY